MFRYFILLLMAMSGNALPLFAAELRGKVVEVRDGDTIVVLDELDKVRFHVRLFDVDAPEKDQPFAILSKLKLLSLCFRKQVTIRFTKVDRFKRLIGSVDVDGVSIHAACEPRHNARKISNRRNFVSIHAACEPRPAADAAAWAGREVSIHAACEPRHPDPDPDPEPDPVSIHAACEPRRVVDSHDRRAITFQFTRRVSRDRTFRRLICEWNLFQFTRRVSRDFYAIEAADLKGCFNSRGV